MNALQDQVKETAFLPEQTQLDAPSSAITEAAATKPIKPLGRKAYGNIPHLPGSRLGLGDHHCHAGQDTICTTKARDKHDRIIVTEKLDGCNVAVAKVAGEVIALSRSGYRASDSPYVQHHAFHNWVAEHADRFGAVLDDGERLNGEWLAMAHGTLYALAHEPFVVFDAMIGDKRLSWDEIGGRCAAGGLIRARVLSDGPPLTIEAALRHIETSGHGALEEVEGAVWRVERKGAFDFLAKYVRPSKVDGKYLPDISGAGEVWLWGERGHAHG